MNIRFVILAGLLFCIFSVYAQENYRIKRIKIKGNNAFNDLNIKDHLTLKSTSLLKEKILNREPVYFTSSQYNDDVKRLTLFYQKEGYLQFKCLSPDIKEVKGQKLILTFYLDEGEPIVVDKVVHRVDSTDQLPDHLPVKQQRNIQLRSRLRPGVVFKDAWCIEDQALIGEQFGNIGYAFAKANYRLKVDTLTNTTDVEWDVNKGDLTYFGSVFIAGNEKVPNKSILKQLAFKPGDVWSKDAIDLSQRRIYSLGMFSVSSIKTINSEERQDTLPIKINIKEAPRWTTRFGVGYGREDKFRVFADVQKLGVLTHTGRLNLFAKHSALEPYNFYLKFTQPAFGFPINSLILHPYLRKQNEPGYSVEKLGFNVNFLQNFTDNFNTSVNFFYEDVTQDTSYVSVGATSFDPESFYTKAGVSLGFAFNSGEPKLDPINGFYLAVNTKSNGVLVTKDMPFYRVLIDARKYFGVSYGFTLAAKGKLGMADATNGSAYLPPDERFYAGGATSVRGWKRAELGPKDDFGRPIGGNSLLEASLEGRINLTPALIMAVFADAGNVWRSSYTYKLGDLRYAVGVGFRVNTPIGPAGIDFARPVFDSEKALQIHFNIGHPF